jgi:hypothetical protein
VSALEAPERISGSTYEDGFASGLAEANRLAVEATERGRAQLVAYRAMIRAARRDLVAIRQVLPADVQPKLAGVEGLLERLAYASTEPA